jgi:hypothetical protein
MMRVLEAFSTTFENSFVSTGKARSHAKLFIGLFHRLRRDDPERSLTKPEGNCVTWTWLFFYSRRAVSFTAIGPKPLLTVSNN